MVNHPKKPPPPAKCSEPQCVLDEGHRNEHACVLGTGEKSKVYRWNTKISHQPR